MNFLNQFLFSAFPYISIVVFLLGTIYRYRATGFQFSSLSSQFLEGKSLFWGAVPFHWGILVVFFGHVVAFLFPKTLLAWNSQPVRLLILEGTAFIFALSMFVGLITLFLRRLTYPRTRVVTNTMDIILEVLLLLQVLLGCWIALGYRWGSSWFAADLSPYLWSIVKFSPEIDVVGALPLVVKFHIVGAFLILFLFPFTRLVHFLVAPFHYLWRPYQRVLWYWDRKKVFDPHSVWTPTRPKNN